MRNDDNTITITIIVENSHSSLIVRLVVLLFTLPFTMEMIPSPFNSFSQEVLSRMLTK